MGTPHVGMRTPWGPAQDVTCIAPGICSVSTAGHGGLKVDRALNARIPEYMRREGGWYEEDSEYILPLVALADHFLGSGVPNFATQVVRSGKHIEMFRNSYPDAYERFFGRPVMPGESSVRDAQMFYAVHANSLLVSTAWGDWHPAVPKGMVGVVARIGGRHGPGRYFLVPAKEYEARTQPSFVVDPTRHVEVAPW